VGWKNTPFFGSLFVVIILISTKKGNDLQFFLGGTKLKSESCKPKYNKTGTYTYTLKSRWFMAQTDPHKKLWEQALTAWNRNHPTVWGRKAIILTKTVDVVFVFHLHS